MYEMHELASHNIFIDSFYDIHAICDILDEEVYKLFVWHKDINNGINALNTCIYKHWNSFYCYFQLRRKV